MPSPWGLYNIKNNQEIITMTQVPNDDRPQWAKELASEFKALSNKVERFDERFSDYQQATQWVVQLAFALIATSTVTVIVSAVFRK
jgi:hypothetical protein